MLNSDKFFPYPVLNNNSEDFRTSKIEFQYTQIKTSIFLLHCKLILKNATIKKLLEEKKAIILVNIECLKTRYRVSKVFDKYDFEIEVAEKYLEDKVQVASMIIATQDIPDYTNIDFVDELKDEVFYIKKNAILAFGDDLIFDVERNTDNLENTPSIFTIIRDNDYKAKKIATEFTNTKIQIKLNRDTFNLYKILQNNSTIEQILAQSIVYPVLVNIISSFESLEMEYKDAKWFVILNRRLKELRYNDYSKFNTDAISIAQEILGDTFIDSLHMLREIVSDKGDDDDN